MDAGTTELAGWGRLPVVKGREESPEELEAAHSSLGQSASMHERTSCIESGPGPTGARGRL